MRWALVCLVSSVVQGLNLTQVTLPMLQENQTSYSSNTRCIETREQMSIPCGMTEIEKIQKACEHSCIEAVSKLRRNSSAMDNDACLEEWEAVSHIQKTQCPQGIAGITCSGLSVTTIAWAILSVFVLFSC